MSQLEKAIADREAAMIEIAGCSCCEDVARTVRAFGKKVALVHWSELCAAADAIEKMEAAGPIDGDEYTEADDPLPAARAAATTIINKVGGY